MTALTAERTPVESIAVARPPIALGLRANWKQFTLLVVVSAFVGAMVGLERTVLPVIATDSFHIASTTAIMSFIATFGLAKAFTNLAAGGCLTAARAAPPYCSGGSWRFRYP